jgi:hypothetical protein
LDGDSQRRSAFSSTLPATVVAANTFQLPAQSEHNNVSASGRRSRFAVFHHISTGADPAVLREQLRLSQNAAQQLSQRVPVFYSVVGNSSIESNISETEIDSICRDGNHDLIDCRVLPHFQVSYEGETLRHLHGYCKQYPESSVAYVQSVLPLYLNTQITEPTERHNLLMHLSRAALSRECIESVSIQDKNASTCNTCGLVFYKLWTLFYPGNMFVSTCEYVNGLLPPDTFEERMVKHVESSLVSRLYQYLQSHVFPGPPQSKGAFARLGSWAEIDRMELWGLDRFSVDFWLGSHPNLNPCDVSGLPEQNLTYWRQLPATADPGKGQFSNRSEFGPSVLAPTHGDGAPVYFDRSAYEQTLADPQSRLLEITFLAGHVSRWYHLYGAVPHASSRIWSWFPDSDTWKEATMNYGKGAIEKIASQFVTIY